MNFSVNVATVISLRRTKNVVAISVSTNREHTERIDLLMEPLEEALMEKHGLSELRYLSKNFTLGQNPVAQLFWRAVGEALSKRKETVHVRRHWRTYSARHDERSRKKEECYSKSIHWCGVHYGILRIY